MPFVKLSNKSLYYADIKPHTSSTRDDHGPLTLVFLHGLGSSSSAYFPLVDYFSAFRCVAIDTHGAARSAYSQENTSITTIKEDVLEVLEALDLQDVVVVGHSMGALIGMELAGVASSRIVGFIGLGPIIPNPDSKAKFGTRIELVQTREF
jgi:pimeloyl-ACP methyl ester carboxylesterase